MSGDQGDYSYEDGEGYVAADVAAAEPEPLDPLRERFWIPLAPAVLWAGWDLMNLHGRVKYEALKPMGAHPWQRAGLTGRDLPDHVRAERVERAEAGSAEGEPAEAGRADEESSAAPASGATA